jgi:hypothetical protein
MKPLRERVFVCVKSAELALIVCGLRAGIVPSIEMIWKFDNVRNFTSVKLHCNNMFTKEVRVFRESLVSFSVSDVRPKFDAPPVAYR